MSSRFVYTKDTKDLTIFKSVVVEAASSWWGFITADDRQQHQAIIRSGLCKQDHKTINDSVEDADDKLFIRTFCAHTKNTLYTLALQKPTTTFGLDAIILRLASKQLS